MRRQDNFRSRLFGMFSEDVVRFWARGDAPYVPVRQYVVVEGAVSSGRARQLYDDATAVFGAALVRVPPLPTA